ncbi:glycosyltransferase [Shewanella sp. SG44-2]|uniref:glycosyltransferase n=1 Tax=Shewanella sp. SG44-2 TaxID=2760962 RepID=UPI001602CF25|nr:glycosyltransferase [Shewanella sp. SG44-2]MBB1428479.1 glycosyltransferase [Shewanella sp. SG44-2]
MISKVALISNSFNPGVSDFFLSKLGVDNVVYFKNKNLTTDRKVRISSYTKKSAGDFFFIIDLFLSFYVLFICVKKSVKTVIFDNAHISNIPLAFLLKIFGKKLVFTIHDWIPHPGKNKIVTKLYNFCVKTILSDEIIVFSEVSDFNSCPIIKQKLAGFIDISNNDDLLSKLNSGPLLFFGRFEPYKGIGNLLNIIPALRKLGITNKIIIAGSGFSEHINELSSFEGVEVINQFIEDEYLITLFSHASVSLLPYDSATQSGVTVLSYMFGVPVVAYNVGNLSEDIVVNKTGQLVKHLDHHQFAKSCMDILNNHQFYIANSRNRFLSTHSEECSLLQFKKYISKF